MWIVSGGRLTKPVAYLLVIPVSLYLFVFLSKDGNRKARKVYGIIGLFVIVQISFLGGWKGRNVYSTESIEFTSTTGYSISKSLC